MIDRETEPRQKESKKVIDNGESKEYIDSKKQVSSTPTDIEGGELAVYNTLKNGEKYVDEIINECGLEAKEVLSALTMLEIKGHIKRLAGKSFTLC
jgi:predicted Rossmann fold nucleotide-binding protein DprA/Smf involved in DNA uptake